MIHLRNGATMTDYYLYNIILLICFIWLVFKHRKSSLHILVITLFWSGMFSDFGKDVLNIQKIITLIWSFFLFTKAYTPKIANSLKGITFFLFTFSVYFLIDTFIYHSDSITLVVAQLSKYLIPYFIYFAMLSEFRYKPRLLFFNKLIYEIILVQIILSLIKYFVILNGIWYEGWVGSLTGFEGGAPGTSLPLLALLWYTLNTNLTSLKKKDILFIFGLLFIGLATGKRAIWFLFPILFSILSITIAQKKISKQYLYLILLVPLIFYGGLRLSPTLNPEGKAGGSFNPEFAWNYLLDYSAGKKDPSGKRLDGNGRLGAVQLVWSDITNGHFSDTELWGNGATYIYTYDHDNYTNTEYWGGIHSRGAVTGVLTMYFATGIIGVVLFLLLLILYPKRIKFQKLKAIILGFQLFLFIFYVGSIISSPALMILYVYLIFLSSIQYNSKGVFTNQLNWYFN